MDELESQIAKIQLANSKSANSFVYIVAEKAAASQAEIYMVAELPMLNPAAEESCQQICLSIASTLKRVYRKPADDSTFENAVAQINEELGKLASTGQTHWINKLNCVIAVKNGKGFAICSSGKIVAYLLRGGELTDISCSSPQSHPLKTFENVAFGKIRLGDLIVLSTTQLFNYLSLDRLRTILTHSELLPATQTIIELLKENAGPEVAFGTLLNLQVAEGQTSTEEIDLEEYVVENHGGPTFLTNILTFIKSTFAINSDKRKPKVGLPRISFTQKIKNLGGSTKDLATKTKTVFNKVSQGVTAGKDKLDLANYKNFTPQKKFFLISAGVLLVSFVFFVIVATYYKNREAGAKQIAEKLTQTQDLLNNSQTSLLYNDNDKALSFLVEAENSLPNQETIPKSQQGNYTKVVEQITTLKTKMEKSVDVTVENVGSLNSSERLIKLQKYLATQINGNIISFNKDTKLIQDGVLKSSETIVSAVALTKTSVIFNGTSLFVWDFEAGTLGPAFSSSVPNKEAFVGLKFYPTNSRVYTVNKSANQVLSFSVAGTNLSRPVVAVTNSSNLSTARDLAIDGSIYVLLENEIVKFQAGKPAEFNMPHLFTPLSSKGKIATEINYKNLYILDSGNNRILILDKQGDLVSILKSDKFTKLMDFQVDEPNKTIYVLNDSSLLKVTLP